jgi:hypothetical protein
MYSLYTDFKNEKILLVYFGVFSDEITSMLIDLSETYMTKVDNFKKLSKRVSFLIAESFQNLIRHGIIEKVNYPEIKYNKDFFQIAILADSVAISSANVILQENVTALDEKINHLNSLSNSELKSHKNRMLIDGELSKKGGAGLGLIEMKRKSGLPLQKQFIKLTEKYYLLILSLEIPMNKATTTRKTNIKTIEKFYKSLVDEKVLLLYKGDFSESSNSSLIEILNKNLIKNDRIESKQLKNMIAVIEVMQNVSKYGKLINGYKEGIFSVSEMNNELYIKCSNFVKHEDYEKLKNNLEEIKSNSIEDLENLYKEKLKNSHLSKSNDAGLGLIEIARFTENTFTYNFVETDYNEIFFSIKIKTT